MKLSDTQRVILSRAAEHAQGLAYPPERLPAAARQMVAKALLKHDLVIAVHRPATDAIATWTVDGEEMLLRITDAGLRAIGIEPETPEADADEPEDTRPRDERNGVDPRFLTGIDEDAAAPLGAPTGGETVAPHVDASPTAEAAQAAPTPAPRANLRDAAQRVLAAWDDEANPQTDLATAIDVLRQIVAKPARTPREPAAPRKPREGTKQQAVLALLRREQGATIAQICEATGWQPHTVRGFFAGLKTRQGISVVAAERIRQVGPNKDGAKGSYSIYRIADAG